MIVLSLYQSSIFVALNNYVTDLRMELAPVNATGDIVFVGIDKNSLDAVEVWPWPRSIHAGLVDRLIERGVAEIFFDVDFSAPSTPQADLIFADALAAAEGAVTLPAFVQASSVNLDSNLKANFPIDLLRNEVWLASVNLSADRDGVIRRYPFAQHVEGEDIPSFAAMLAGVLGPGDSDFAINFAIQPQSVPVFSFIDVLEGRVEAALLEGKSIVVGAHAIELRDNFNVPVHGIIPGALLQIIAAETLSQRMELRTLEAGTFIVALTTLLFLLLLGFRRPRFRHLLVCFGTVSFLIELAAFILQSRYALVLPTPALHALLICAAGVLGVQELNVRKWLLQIAKVDRSNTQRILSQIVADSSDAIVVISDDGKVIEMSHRSSEIFGTDIGVDGGAFENVVLPDELLAAARSGMADLDAGTWRDAGVQELTLMVSGETRYIEYSVTPSRLAKLRRTTRAAENTLVACITARDITMRRVQAERLDYLVRFDVLTGAMRRTEFIDRLQARLEEPPADGMTNAVFVLNLRRFKTINTTLGRNVGDALLKAVIERLWDCDPCLSQVARFGGDHLSLFTRTDIKAVDAQALADRLSKIVTVPFDLDGSNARIGARIGIALQDPTTKGTANDLLEKAEAALDEANKVSGDAVAVFDPSSFARQERSRLIDRALWTSLENEEFFVAYQPQVRLSDQQLIGAEALVRWQHPTLGMVSPVEFIEVAESSGFIEHLGRWVLEKACQDAIHWPAHMSIAVNVSPIQFQRSDIVADVRAALLQSGLDAKRLNLEVTESIFVDGSTQLSETLADLRAMGISIALDDFGSGFSSFGYLTAFPLDKLKLDRMFVTALESNKSNEAIIKSVQMLAAELNLKLICEGVETAYQRDYLWALGCDEGQGYLFAKPQSQEEILALAASWNAGSNGERCRVKQSSQG